MKADQEELSSFKINLPISSHEFFQRVKKNVQAFNPNDSKRYFSTTSLVDYGSVDIYENKIIVWKLRKLLNQPSNVGTGKIEMTFDTPGDNTLTGTVIIGSIPAWGLAAVMLFFGFVGIEFMVFGEWGLGIFTTLIGLAIVSINLLLRRDYYSNVRSYGMNFIKDVMKES